MLLQSCREKENSRSGLFRIPTNKALIQSQTDRPLTAKCAAIQQLSFSAGRLARLKRRQSCGKPLDNLWKEFSENPGNPQQNHLTENTDARVLLSRPRPFFWYIDNPPQS